jgi:serine/threonine-protein kinase
LNHPNIAQIYGLEKSNGVTGLVMELVEGPTLANRIAEGPISIDEALPIAKQIADALEAAHDQGIIHRDLKPSNIKLRPDGTVKVLDFGLAKAMDPISAMSSSHSMSPTITTPAVTQMGMILGTAAYMAPEQARGKAVDKRADIWAFGVLIYEMLIGTPLFGGDTVSDTIAAVLTKEPDWKQVPAQARPLLRRCLERDPKKRLRDIGDAMALVEGEPQLGTDARHARTRWLWAATAVVLAFAAGIVLSERLMTAPAATPVVTRFSIPFPGAGGPPFPAGLSLSRDGSRLAFGEREAKFTSAAWINS